MTLHVLDHSAAFGYDYGYGIQLMLHLVDYYTGNYLTFGKDSLVVCSVPAEQCQLNETKQALECIGSVSRHSTRLLSSLHHKPDGWHHG